MINAMIPRRLISLCGLLTLCGCSLGRGAPAPQQYVLGGELSSPTAAGPPALAGVTVGVRRLDLAAYLGTPAILVRRGTQEITSSAFHRWSEPLDAGISRVLAEYLRAQAPFAAVDVAPWPVRAEHDYLVQLEVLRFEGAASEDAAATSGEAHVQTSWQIVRTQDEAVLERGTTEFRRQGWEVGDYGALVELFNAGLEALAVELTAGMERARLASPAPSPPAE